MDQNEGDAFKLDAEKSKLLIDGRTKFEYNLEDILQIISRDLTKANIGDLVLDDIEMIKKSLNRSHSHFTGGLSSFVSSELELTNCPNVFVCCAGILPYRGYANPTASLFSAAQRLAKRLIQRH